MNSPRLADREPQAAAFRIAGWHKGDVLPMIAVAAGYVALTFLALRLMPFMAGSMVWLPGGLALAALLLLGPRYWPAVFLGAVAGSVMIGAAPGVALVNGVGKTMAPLAAAWFLHRVRMDPSLARLRDYLWLVVASFVAGVINPLFGVGIQRLLGHIGWQRAIEQFAGWWLGDVVGMLLLVPLILVWRQPLRRDWTRQQILEAVACFGLALGFAQIALLGWEGSIWREFRAGSPAFLFVMWAGVRFGRRAALLMIGLIFAHALVGLQRGTGYLVSQGMFEVWIDLLSVYAVGICIAIVVGARDRTVSQLEESEERFASVAANIPYAVWRRDLEGRMTFANQAYLNAYGKTWDEIKGTTLADVYPDDAQVKMFLAEDRRIMERDEVYSDIEERLNLASGRRVFIDITKTPLHDAAGRVVGFQGMYIDITERKLTDDTMRLLAQPPAGHDLVDVCRPLAQHLAETLQAEHVFFSRLVQEGSQAQTIIAFSDGAFGENFSYALESTPCAEAIGNEVCVIERDVCPRFPADAVLGEMAAEGYIGVALTGAAGRIIGLITVISRKPIAYPDLGARIVQLVAPRIAQEMERAETGKALVRSTALLESTQAIAKLGGWESDLENGQLYWSAELYRLFDTTPDALEVKPWVILQFCTPESRVRLEAKHKAAVEHGVEYDLEIDLVTAKGRNMVGRTSCVVTLRDGKPVKLTGILHDMTEAKMASRQSEAQQAEIRRLLGDAQASRQVLLSLVEDQKQAAQAWHESEIRLASIVESALDAIITVDEQFQIQVFNAAAARMFHCEAGQAVGTSIERFIPARFRSDHASQMRAFGKEEGIARRMAIRAAVNGLRADGTEFPVEASISHVVLEGRTIYTVIMRDVTEREESEEERLLLEVQLRESQKMEAMGTLAGGIAHDFNNILGAIIGNVALAREELGQTEASRESLAEIAKAGQRAKALVDQILTFSRRQTQELMIQPLQPVIEEAVRLLRATIPAGIQIEVALLPQPVMASINATQFSQVLINLCTNAWHAMEGGPGNLQVALDAVSLDAVAAQRFGALPAGRYASLQVRDSGVGMDAATQTHIFEPFFTTKAPGSGTGLGLAVVHGIVMSHHGGIRVQSTPGAGTLFEVCLPLVEGAAPAQAISAPAPAVVAGGGKHLLYLDDDAAMVFLMERLLRKRGFRVSGFTEAEPALAAVRANPAAFDLVVTDFNMPKASGLDVARDLAALRADLPVVITSGYITDALREGARTLGVREVVYKPNSADELVEAVGRVLGSLTD